MYIYLKRGFLPYIFHRQKVNHVKTYIEIKIFIPPPPKKSLTTDFFVQAKCNNELPWQMMMQQWKLSFGFIYPVHTSVFGSVRYRNGAAPPVHISKWIAPSIPFQSESQNCVSRSGTKYSGTFWVAQFIMWTGGSVPFQNRYGRIRFRTDPNCTGTVCTGTELQMWTG